MPVRLPRLSGLLSDNDAWHYVVEENDRLPTADNTGRRLAPRYIVLPNKKQIPKWGPSKRDRVDGFRPAKDCDGYFMANKFQPNNNCYNYACNVATSTFAQPGRRHGKMLLNKGQRLKACDVITGAQADGLRLVGLQPMSLAQALKSEVYLNGVATGQGGHLVALLLSPARSSIRWRGDYHWVRCDHPSGRTWSQKDGRDHVTNYDFQGNRIANPTDACWAVNMGPPQTDWGFKTHRLTSKVVEYSFQAWMFVPNGKVSII